MFKVGVNSFFQPALSVNVIKKNKGKVLNLKIQSVLECCNASIESKSFFPSDKVM